MISSIGTLDEEVIQCYLHQILHAVQYLHRNDIAHRDLKCANLLLTEEGQVKLADFGAAKRLHAFDHESR